MESRADKIAFAFGKFAEHKATFTDLGSIQILDWRKPGTMCYRVRYVFDVDAGRIYISGNLGAAVVHPTWKATFEATCRNTGYESNDCNVNEGYFLEKVEATSDRYVYDREAAERCVKEHCPGIEGEDEGYILETVMESFDDQWGLRHIGDKARKILSDYDEDCWRWFPEAGQSIDCRIYLWLVGLKMAWKQLHGEG